MTVYDVYGMSLSSATCTWKLYDAIFNFQFLQGLVFSRIIICEAFSAVKLLEYVIANLNLKWFSFFTLYEGDN